jgi:hypothetical protein
MSECDVSVTKNKKTCKETSNEAVHLARFMMWAYDEVNENLKDDFLKSAIKTILYYMAKKYGVSVSEHAAALPTHAS